MSCVAAAAVLVIAACGGDASTGPGSDNLSTEQLRSMTSSLFFIVGTSLGAPRSISPEGLRAIGTTAASAPIGGRLECPVGGYVRSDGTLSIDDAGNSLFASTDSLVGCGVVDEHSNTWTFTSKPTIAVTIAVPTNIHGDSIDLGHSTLIQSDAGTVAYTTGALSGKCSLDVTITLDITRGSPTADSTTVMRSTAGTVCGHSVTWDTTTTALTPRT
jgi:hypothetical protein